ncbi:4Fe-4S binding protein [Jannaschia aquimarina]|uniref:RsxB protein n=1 Tax=Jannaschia aquimarina TaxID=935700 RepID=A0A0D1EIQ6_9RHOB|nr:4Fe-4S binding protein [Jannaschia aquimarina]KIT15715.1 Electron transport complex subunit RsxB [Jannaschia aquimarina]SNT38769.1 4Fe-4S dicluster domain-containing protein [Jannaschia aquimarina]
MTRQIVLCDCAGSQDIDADGLSSATGLSASKACSHLCTRQIDVAAKALKAGDALIACTQEADTFTALAEDLGLPAPALVDIRDRAGWTDDGRPTLPKMAALVAEAQLPAAPHPTLDVISEGLCLIAGPADVAFESADRLKDHLSVTVLIGPDDAADPPIDRGWDLVKGTIRNATGSLGRFSLRLDRLQQLDPAGRDRTFTSPRDGAESACDILVDLRGEPPLFPAPEKRDGYLRADPGHPQAVADVILAASHLSGTFEKTLHVRTEPLLCAHSRAEQVGCTRCLDLCPTGAITPNGEHISVDPLICAGCGACSAACPSGAIALDAPPVDATMRRVQTLATAYRMAGGDAPRLLVVDPHGTEMIALAARYGRGLPSDVIPIEVDALNGFGHAEALAGLAAGFGAVIWLPAPRTDRAALDAQVALTRALAPDASALILDVGDPDAMADALRSDAPPAIQSPIRPMGTRRQIARQAATALNGGDATLPLPDGAPYGAVLVDTEACTLCLSCVSLCPSGALGDNPDRPQLRFQEDACLQCGLCANICPEDAITLDPRMDTSPAALSQRVLHEEEPALCIECGAAFGVASTIERIVAKLEGHSMFGGDRARLIRMCNDCRIAAQVHSADNPFASNPRPRPRTTADELSKRRDH